MAKKVDYFDEIYSSATRTLFNEETNEWSSVDEFGRTRAQLLEEYSERANELDSIGSVYQTADKIITGDDISVSVVSDPDMDTNASNNGKEIVFNANLIEDLTSETIAELHGTNYHEVAHILFSPRAGSALGQYVREQKALKAFNLLEEARIEKLMISKYPSTRLFLEANTLNYGLKDDSDNWGLMYPLITGRKYIDVSIRQTIADKFIAEYGVELAREVHDINNEYRSLVFPNDFDKAKLLIDRYLKLVGRDDEPQGKIPTREGKGCMPRPVLTKGRPTNSKEQEKLQEKPDSNPDEKLDPASGGVGGDSAEDKSITERDSDDEAIAKSIAERVKEIANDNIVKREVNDTRKAITGNDDIRSVIPFAKYDESPVTMTAKMYARKFSQELERMVRDNDPAWERRLPSGKLNISRTMNPDVNAIGELFDVWDIGNPNTEIEAVMLLDNSGSMGGYMRDVCENAWIIKRGIESINGVVSVYTFDHESKKLYERGDSAKPNMYRNVWSRGSTNPVRALYEAERIFKASDKPIKVIFIITDGEWDSNDECDSVIKRLKDNGITTCLLYISNYKQYRTLVENSRGNDGSAHHAREYLSRLNHGVDIFEGVASPKDVLKVADSLVKSTLVRVA
jgi:hypothetical protein